MFFFETVPFVRDAHRAADDGALERAYGFAHWCFRQGGELQNAAAVSFFEHLFDSWDIHRDVLNWIDRPVLRECWPLFEARLDAEKLAVVRRHLND